ncbi:MAG: sugar transferase [Acidimicrobiia bacterium]|nr:sugar transferase [Acidimicrobiia bacterium]
MQLGETTELDLTDGLDTGSVRLQLPFAAIGPRTIQLQVRTDLSPGAEARGVYAKRMLDIIGAAVLLVLALPLMIGVAVAIKATSPGPVFYLHERVGRRGQPFRVWKFRSMRSDVTHADIADVIALDEHRVNSPVYKSPNDPRITRVGRFIRRTGIDELPQLFNVLGSSMSLVGPRPLVDEEVAELSVEEFKRRNSVAPGVTGLWQVFRRSETSFEERMRLDLTYVGCRGLLLDLYLLVMTPLALVRGDRSF